MQSNKKCLKANKNDNDEFYTMYESIESELIHYKDYIKDKIIYCNCDDPEQSNFWKYFHDNFNELKIKKLISTHYDKNNKSYALIYNGVEDIKEELVKNSSDDLFNICDNKSNGDFRSEECIKYLKEADIIITNPPFSLFRDFITLMMEYNKKFLIIGNQMASCYKEVFPFIKDNKIHYGYNIPIKFPYLVNKENSCYNKELTDKMISKYPQYSDKYFANGSRTAWFTNIDIDKEIKFIELTKEYNETEYPKYDYYDAINSDKTNDIPKDYFGLIGVPITFLEHYNPNQFEIVDGIGRYSVVYNEESRKNGKYLSMINGVSKYFRVIIKRK